MAQFPCNTDQLHQALIKSDSTYLANYEKIQTGMYHWSQNYYQSLQKRNKVVYTIPVVLHIIAPPGTPIGTLNNLTDAEAEAGLQLLNQAFSNTGAFKTVNGVDVGIQFCLALRDPNGKPTNGITRTYSSLVADVTTCSPFGTPSSADGAIKALVNWDCTQYLNFWLVTDLFDNGFGCGLAGYAYFPGAPCTVDGIVQEGRYWTTIGGTQVTAHEVGHYLSLNHTFNGGCTNTNCLIDGDGVCDTPPDNSPSFAACNTNSCTTDIPDLPDDNTNYMDYTGCSPLHFTAGQRIRMIAGLENGRASLIKSPACIPLVAHDASLLFTTISSVNCGENVCPQILIKNNGTFDIANLLIGYKINNTNEVIFNWNGNLKTYETVNIQLPCSPVSLGNNKLVIYVKNVNTLVDDYTFNDSLSVSFISYPRPQLSALAINGSRCISNGSVVLEVKSGSPQFAYQIEGYAFGQTNPRFNMLATGDYNFIVYDSVACTDTLLVHIPDSCDSKISQDFVLNNDAYYSGGPCYRLTEEKNGQSGSVWYKDKINLLSSFDIIFDVNLGCIDGNGADGIAFVLQPLSTNLGVAGGGLGYQGISPSIEVEFDTYQNCCDNSRVDNGANDPAQDHMAIMRNGAVNHLSPNNLAGPIDIITNTNAEDCKFHTVRISWDALLTKLDVYYDCNFKLSYTGDIIKTIFNNNPEVYFGFTGATGGSINLQQVCFQYSTFFDRLKDQTICKGSNSQNAAPSYFNKYKWSPKKYVSNDSIRNPVFNPVDTTTFYLEMTDLCGFTVKDTFTLNVVDLDLYLKSNFNNPCDANSLSGIIASIKQNFPWIQYSIDGINFTSDSIFKNLKPGLYTIYAKSGECILPQIIKIKSPIPLQDSLLFLNAERCKQKGVLAVQGVKGFPPYQYRIDGGGWQLSGTFDSLNYGNHKVEILDAMGCAYSNIYKIPLLNSKIAIRIDSSDIYKSCTDTFTYFAVTANGTSPYYHYKLDNQAYSTNAVFKDIPPGMHAIFVEDEYGCTSDSLFFEIKNEILHKKQNNPIELCEGLDYIIGKHTYNTAGTYLDSFLTYTGCDSIIETNLIYNNKSNTLLNPKICDGDFFQVGKRIYTKNGKYLDTLLNQFSCDSFIETNLTINPVYVIKNDQQICEGDFIQIGNNKYTKSGIFKDTLLSIQACDSIIVSALLVHPVYVVNNIQTKCEPDSVNVGNNTYKQTGKYIDSLQTLFFCDSVILSDIIINPIKRTKVFPEICFGDVFYVGNKAYTRTGIYHDILQTYHTCDSLIETNLLVHNLDTERLQLNICEGDTFTLNSLHYTEAGFYKQILEDRNHCDSTIEINLGTYATPYTLLEYILCPGDSFRVGNKYYYQNGAYQDILNTVLGCDSTVSTQLKRGDDFYCDSLHCNMYVPNVFSPNGDFLNDEFNIHTEVLQINQLQIFNRWGELIFQTKENPVKWNGKNQHSENILPGVYVWLIEATCSNGKKVRKYGEITLIR